MYTQPQLPSRPGTEPADSPAVPRSRRRIRRTTLIAIALAGALTFTTPPLAVAASLLPNGDFEAVDTNGAPSGWYVWKAAGTGTSAAVVNGAGPTGTKALELVGDSTDDRIAVSRRVNNPDPSRTQYFKVAFDQRAEGVSGSSASVRVQYLGANGALKPLTLVGRTTGTHGWRHVQEYVSAPVGTTQLSIEPMLDSAKGKLSYDNLTVEAVEAQSILSATPQPTGEIELFWNFSDADATAYEIHRSSEADFTPSEATLIRTLPNFPAAEDPDTEPGVTYTYKVVALDSAGTAVGTSLPAIATAPKVFADDQRTDVLSATATGDGARLAWRMAEGTTGSVTVYAGDKKVVAGDLRKATKVGTYPVDARGVTLTHAQVGKATGFALVRSNEGGPADVLGSQAAATAELSGLQHPRFGATDDRTAKIRRLIAEPGAPREMWQQLTKRVETGISAYPIRFGEGEGRWAAEAALAYRVTGDKAYAQTAYEAFAQAEPKLLFFDGQVLETANPTTFLAQSYDWAYDGWTEEQRADARRVFARVGAYFEVAHHANVEGKDKASNWAAVVRGAELAMWLAVRGDGEFGSGERRIPGLVDDLRRHLDAAYSDTGWDQEGLDYLSYGLTIAGPGIIGARDTGITALDASWHRPAFGNILMHSLSLQDDNARLQWGVGSATGTVPASAYLLDTVPKSQLPGWLWHYERTVGAQSAGKGHFGSHTPFALINWPEDVAPQDPDLGPSELRAPLLDDHAGAYQFRSRYQDADDVLVGATNRNKAHIGWNGLETFGLSLVSHGATWARQPGKAYTTNPELFSKPLIDGRPEHRSNTGDRSPGKGKTLASRAYRGQGGGFLSLDGRLNYEVTKAQRDLAVDLRSTGGADAVIALHDSFADSSAHTYTWQLSPEAGTEITFGNTESSARTFLFQKDGAWLKGWVLAPDGAELSTHKGAFRVTRTGTSADFRIVLATGRGTPPTATTSANTLMLGSTAYDLDDLAALTPPQLTE
ncbi:hypothetical protein ACPCAC_06940 [Streptomyces lavendulocolor]|uniref:hypothetical protein n=1 Tax=Streptomyces lavendulocolor TaxID=67316 RepID=UPI003C2E1811